MKKRVVAGIALLSVIFMLLSGVCAAESGCFVGINDSIPLYLPADQAPYYKGSLLYIPYTVFDTSPGGIAVSYNAGNQSLALFTRAKRLVYDLEAGTVTDEAQKVSKFEPVYRNGLLFIPASKALTHFGLSYTMLSSRSGSSVLRITDGSQTLDNATFVRKAETLISIILEQQGNQSGGNTQTSESGIEETPRGPATVYLAFVGDAVSEETLNVLEDNEIYAAFFLTEEQLEQDMELVWKIYKAGHQIGLAVAADSVDPLSDLARSNHLLDQIVFKKSLMVLLPETVQVSPQYATFKNRMHQPSIDDILKNPEEMQLFVCDADAAFAVHRLVEEGAYLPQLLENSVIPGITS